MVAVRITLHQGMSTFKLDFRIDTADNSRIGHAVYMVTNVGQAGFFAGLTNSTAGNFEFNTIFAYPFFLVIEGFFQGTPEQIHKAFQ